MSRAEDAQMRLYELTDVRDELTDDQADKLLKWAEAEITRLDESGISDEEFTAKTDALIAMLADINRFAGRQGQFSAQGVSEYPALIAAQAEQLGHPLSADQITAAGTGDPLTTIDALTTMMTTPADSTPKPPEPEAAPTDTAETQAPVIPLDPSGENTEDEDL